jgi:hypothetical protein
MAYPGFGESYKSASTRARVVVILLAITALVLAWTALFHASGFDLIAQAEAGTLTDQEAADFDTATQALAGTFLIFFVATAIAYLAWLSRTVDNIPHLTGELPMVTPRWSIGWWFVPIANVFKPYQIVKDAATRLAPNPSSAEHGVILTWWLVWIASGLLGTIVSRLPEPETLNDLTTWFAANLIADVVLVVAAILAIIVVRRVQSLANDRAAAVATIGAAGTNLPPCPRCGVPRVAGSQFCTSCGLDFWAEYDRSHRDQAPSDGAPSETPQANDESAR